MTPTDPTSPKASASAKSADQSHRAHDEHLYDPLHNEDVAHEHSDVNVRALLMSAVGLGLVVLLCAGVVYGLFQLLERQAAGRDMVVSPLARPTGQRPPEPRLLTNEPQNLDRFRAEQAEALEGIDDAKKQLLQQGLPVRADAPEDAWLGTRSPATGESSGGRAIPLARGAPKQF